MKKTESFRTLAIFITFLIMSIVICISNIVKLNIFALVLDMIMIVSICFVLGYNYCKYESQKPSKNYEKEEKDVDIKHNTPQTISIIGEVDI